MQAAKGVMAFASFLVNQASYADHGNSVPAPSDTEEGKIICLSRSETPDLGKLLSVQRDLKGKSIVYLAGPGIWHNFHSYK